MGLSDRLRRLDAKVIKNTKYLPGVGGGGLRHRRPNEDLRAHLKYCSATGGFGSQVVAADVLALLDRVDSLEVRLRELEGPDRSIGR